MDPPAGTKRHLAGSILTSGPGRGASHRVSIRL